VTHVVHGHRSVLLVDSTTEFDTVFRSRLFNRLDGCMWTSDVVVVFANRATRRLFRCALCVAWQHVSHVDSGGGDDDDDGEVGVTGVVYCIDRAGDASDNIHGRGVLVAWIGDCGKLYHRHCAVYDCANVRSSTSERARVPSGSLLTLKAHCVVPPLLLCSTD